MAQATTSGTLILKSFGKFWGLAGLRLGFVIGDPALVARLGQMLGPWPVSGPALHIGAAALRDGAWAEAMRARLATDATRLDTMMTEAGAQIVGGTPLFRLYEVDDAQAWQERLAQHHIWTRVFPYNPRWLRLGLPPLTAGRGWSGRWHEHGGGSCAGHAARCGPWRTGMALAALAASGGADGAIDRLGDRRLNHGQARRAKGAALLLALMIGMACLGWVLSLLGPLAEIIIAAILLAQRSLVEHLRAVADGLRQSLPAGRRAVAMIVSRDTGEMPPDAVARSAIESGAENLSDGIIAPAFGFCWAGCRGCWSIKSSTPPTV